MPVSRRATAVTAILSISASGNAAGEANPWRGEIVIHVGQDIDGLHAAYVKRGVNVIEPPVSQPWGLREFAIREPDGHVLRFCGYI